jgi:aryl sulfotransferase
MPTLIRPAEREYRTWSTDSRRWSPYAPRPDDIIIATSPKCGTTWMQQIVSSLVFGDPKPRALPSVSPWIDARFRGTGAEVHAAIEKQSHRRFLKSHLPIDGLPLYDEVRYIHVARDGRDAVLSMHNHYSGFSAAQLESFDRIGLDDPILSRPYPRIPADPAEYFRLWISTPVVSGQEDGLPAPSFFELEAGYWAERKRGNLLLVHYNDLKKDLDGEMRRIASFLDIELPETTWPSLVSAASFESMRTSGSTLMPQTKTMFVEGANRFFNKGVNGRWRSILGPDELAAYEAKVLAKLSPALAAWLEGGRLSTGDPHETPD